ncbi:MAG: LysR family transcriptional regulator [Clostridiales bacterium]|nr:LysR family transcriptional regulator [Clostridiales bacterium]
MEISYQYLYYFNALAEILHFTKAAEHLHISQPTLTQAIKALEIELKVPLFEKKGRNIRLTKTGWMLYNATNKGLGEINACISKISEMSRSTSGTVRFATGLFPNYDKLLPAIFRFRHDYPDARLFIDVLPPGFIIDGVLSGRFDLAICSHNFPSDSIDDLTWQHITTEEIYLVVPLEHPLAQKSYVVFDDFKDEEFLCFRGPNTVGMTTLFNEGFQDPMIDWLPKCTLYAPTSSIYVAYGLGLSLATKSTPLDSTKVKLVPIRRPLLTRDSYLIRHTQRCLSPTVKAFLAYLLTAYQDIS